MLSTALAVVDAEGLDALTMRQLGQESQRDPLVSTGARPTGQPCWTESLKVLNELTILPTDPDCQASCDNRCVSWAPAGLSSRDSLRTIAC